MVVHRARRRHTLLYLALWVTKWIFRRLTAKSRILPDFLIIGAQRCGTTSLYNYINKHPNVLPAFRKEVHFFDNSYTKGINWYRAHFSHQWDQWYLRRKYAQSFITGEASPYYLFHPHVPERVFETLPHIKLIVILRNPIDRAYSHYHHEVNIGIENLTFEDALQREQKNIDKETQKILSDPHNKNFFYQHYTYLSKGIYINQLSKWAKLFNKKSILILDLESLESDSQKTMCLMTRFLNLPDFQFSDFPKYNPVRYEAMEPDTRTMLQDYFNPYNEQLYRLLGRDFEWS